MKMTLAYFFYYGRLNISMNIAFNNNGRTETEVRLSPVVCTDILRIYKLLLLGIAGTDALERKSVTVF